MSEKKADQDDALMEGRFSVNLAELRPVDQIFPEAHRAVAIATGACVSPPFGCGQKVQGFVDTASAKEYQITGMCQGCQDRFYAQMAEDEEDGEFDVNAPGGEA